MTPAERQAKHRSNETTEELQARRGVEARRQCLRRQIGGATAQDASRITDAERKRTTYVYHEETRPAWLVASFTWVAKSECLSDPGWGYGWRQDENAQKTAIALGLQARPHWQLATCDPTNSPLLLDTEGPCRKLLCSNCVGGLPPTKGPCWSEDGVPCVRGLSWKDVSCLPTAEHLQNWAMTHPVERKRQADRMALSFVCCGFEWKPESWPGGHVPRWAKPPPPPSPVGHPMQLSAVGPCPETPCYRCSHATIPYGSCESGDEVPCVRGVSYRFQLVQPPLAVVQAWEKACREFKTFDEHECLINKLKPHRYCKGALLDNREMVRHFNNIQLDFKLGSSYCCGCCDGSPCCFAGIDAPLSIAWKTMIANDRISIVPTSVALESDAGTMETLLSAIIEIRARELGRNGMDSFEVPPLRYGTDLIDVWKP